MEFRSKQFALAVHQFIQNHANNKDLNQNQWAFQLQYSIEMITSSTLMIITIKHQVVL